MPLVLACYLTPNLNAVSVPRFVITLARALSDLTCDRFVVSFWRVVRYFF